MAIGESGRIVLEVEQDLKRRLYSTLALDQKKLKHWFVLIAEEYIRTQNQRDLFKVLNTEKTAKKKGKLRK
jgi:CRISPR/Cas system-associated protein Cas7 (RAMP superfamily)